LLLTALKVSFALPNYFIKEINYLFYIFVFNTATTFWLSHVLHMRSCILQGRSLCVARCFVALFIVRILILISIVFLGFLFDEILLGSKLPRFSELRFVIDYCSAEQGYPYRFLLVFLLDAVSALFDLIIFIASPKIANKRERLKEARLADIAKQLERNTARKSLDAATEKTHNPRRAVTPTAGTGQSRFPSQNLSEVAEDAGEEDLE